MKLTEVCILFLACFLFIVGKPLLMNKGPNIQQQQEQRQEEVAEEEEFAPTEKEIRIVFKARTAQEEPIADIIWLNRAAGIAIDSGTPYFNVITQHTYKRFVEKEGMELSVIEGTIELVSDPMKSDYDANEISSLSLNQIHD